MSKTLSTLLTILIMIILGGVGHYFLNQHYQSQISDLQSQITELQSSQSSPTNTTTDKTADWKTYTSDTYGISFKYPNSWLDANATPVSASEEPINIAYSSIIFGADEANAKDTVQLSNFSAYTSSEDKASLSSLTEVYNSQEVSSTMKPLWLPNANAGVIAYSAPKYIENSSKTYRGIYYYAFIGQDDPYYSDSFHPLLDFIMVLTNGKDKIFQYHKYTDVAEKTGIASLTFQNSNTCLPSSIKACKIDKRLIDNYTNIYLPIAKSIK